MNSAEMLILTSLQDRHRLLESLNDRISILRGDPQQRSQVELIQDQIDDLRQQQFDEIDTYKSNLLFAYSPTQQDVPDIHSAEGSDTTPPAQNDWTQQFADGFVAYLKENNSGLYSIWLGQEYSYPTYIGFDIKRLNEDFQFTASDASWLAVFLREDRQIYAGLHVRDPFLYQQLESERRSINFAFYQEFGVNLGWRPGANISRVFTLIGVYNDNNQEILFQDIYRKLEKLDEILRPHLEDNQQNWV